MIRFHYDLGVVLFVLSLASLLVHVLIRGRHSNLEIWRTIVYVASLIFAVVFMSASFVLALIRMLK